VKERLNERLIRLDRQIARSVGAPPALRPYLPTLFEGIEAMGSQPSRLTRLLALGGVGKSSRLLDLGCGKGAVGLHAAQVLGCRLVGVDACAEFVEAACELAAELSVGSRCRFGKGMSEIWMQGEGSMRRS